MGLLDSISSNVIRYRGRNVVSTRWNFFLFRERIRRSVWRQLKLKKYIYIYREEKGEWKGTARENRVENENFANVEVQRWTFDVSVGSSRNLKSSLKGDENIFCVSDHPITNKTASTSETFQLRAFVFYLINPCVSSSRIR